MTARPITPPAFLPDTIGVDVANWNGTLVRRVKRGSKTTYEVNGVAHTSRLSAWCATLPPIPCNVIRGEFEVDFSMEASDAGAIR